MAKHSSKIPKRHLIYENGQQLNIKTKKKANLEVIKFTAIQELFSGFEAG